MKKLSSAAQGKKSHQSCREYAKEISANATKYLWVDTLTLLSTGR
jgi:hypothetical protein